MSAVRLTAGVAFAVLAVAAPTHAQLSLLTGGGLIISSSPQYPEPGEAVVLTASSLIADVNRAQIVWYENGVPIGSGKRLNYRVGELGSVATVEAEATSEEGLIAAGSITLRPTEADIVWESDALTPPFYRGRALPGAGTRVRLEADVRFKRPDGSFVPPSDIIYSWERNDLLLEEISGRGYSQVVMPAPLLFGTDRVRLFAESVDGLFSAEATASIPSSDTVLVLYEDHPLFGIRYSTALNTDTSVAESEMTVAAVPYFAQAQAPNDPRLVYRWSVNGEEVATDPSDPSRITLSAEEGGLALINLALEHTTNWFEAARGQWRINIADAFSDFLRNPFGVPNQ